MQYPPQPPTNPSSEVYIHKHSQAYPPQSFTPKQETTQPSMAPQEIAIYPRRRLLILRTAFVLMCLLIVLLAIPALVLFAALSGVPLGISELVPVFLVVIPGAIIVGWISWVMLSILLAHEPMLLINREGIVVSPMPLVAGFSISWGEIEAIFPSYHSWYAFLCIVPKDPDRYLKTHFHGLARLYRQVTAYVGSPLYIAQINLDKRIEEILQHVCSQYASELSYYHIQVRTSPQDVPR